MAHLTLFLVFACGVALVGKAFTDPHATALEDFLDAHQSMPEASGQGQDSEDEEISQDEEEDLGEPDPHCDEEEPSTEVPLTS